LVNGTSVPGSSSSEVLSLDEVEHPIGQGRIVVQECQEGPDDLAGINIVVKGVLA
jgi:hypothetical protein